MDISSCCDGASQELARGVLVKGQLEVTHCLDPIALLREEISHGDVGDACVPVYAYVCAASFSSPSSPVRGRLFHCRHPWENEVSGRDRAEDPCNLITGGPRASHKARCYNACVGGTMWMM